MPNKINYDVVIKPIFDQSVSPVWENFVEIEELSRAEYGHCFLDGSFNNLYYTHFDDWKKLKGNIAFGAYYEDEMVGFVKGFLVDKAEYKLDSLFVKPDFKHQGVGKRLLESFETSVSLVASYIQAISYDGARDFYKKQKYKVYGVKGDNPKVDKKLLMPNQGVFPVFGRWKSSIFRTKLAQVPVDAKLLRESEHHPIFVHVNEKHEIDVVGVKTNQGENQVWISPTIPQDVKNCRENAVLSQLNNIR
ncbi:MAG: GNAT family N-acetyltransferase [Alphaproteobacteria bacterium]|nr:GNAT family N-acetyltransferase [Alphaproteobacteria bacterium]